MIPPEKIQQVRQTDKTGTVIYWMSRDQRVDDNYALLYTQHLSLQKKAPMAVIFTLIPSFLNASFRQYDFMIKGLKQIHQKLSRLNIPFYVLQGYPPETIQQFVHSKKVSTIITEFDPLRTKKKWQTEVISKNNINFHVVDAHNIVPCLYVSEKQEYSAGTFRPKIHQKLNQFLIEFPKLKRQQSSEQFEMQQIQWKELYDSLQVDESVRPVEHLHPGESNALNLLNDFIDNKLKHYNNERNDPNKDVLSCMSPYLHFGQIASQRVALEIQKIKEYENVSSYLEELIVRKELSDNFCHYNKNYDNPDGFHPWAQKTIKEHENDEREYMYSFEEFERAETHDELWNAAQKEMLITGKMHGYMRMYWAKKILEWTPCIENALSIAITLNDKYELDGRDPNGYTGCMWSIGGVHDRAWNERHVFGKIRYMSYNGCKRKFNIKTYIDKYSNNQSK